MQKSEIIEISTKGYEATSFQYTPEVIVFSASEAVDQYAVEDIAYQVKTKPSSTLTLPTGDTPIGVYKKLVEYTNTGKVDLSEVTTFNLDEYYPIRRSHRNSYATYMQNHLFDHVRVKSSNIPDGEALDPTEEAERYSLLLEQHQPVDLAVLGIGPGTTCHLGFNERGSAIDSGVRYVKLDSETIATNAKQFDNSEEMPGGALTQGIADILQAERILLIAKGPSKAWGVNRSLKGPIGPDAPASFLRLHPKVTFAIDKAAGQYLN